MEHNNTSKTSELFLVRDPLHEYSGGFVYNLLMLAIKPYRGIDVAGEEWRSYADFRVHPHLFPEVVWETDPVPATLARITDDEIDDDTIWLGRNADGSLVMSYTKPYRNSVNPWWSAPGKFIWKDDGLFPELSWETDVIPVKIVKKGILGQSS